MVHRWRAGPCRGISGSAGSRLAAGALADGGLPDKVGRKRQAGVEPGKA